MQITNTIGFRRRHLPHWFVADRHYFVTIRLKGSLPIGIVNELRVERERLTAIKPTVKQWNDLQKSHFKKIEAVLDGAKEGPKHLIIPEIGNLVLDAFKWLEEKHGWHITALTIMPNHTHVLMRNIIGNNHLINDHLGVLKGYTARLANTILRRKGAFWMDENFDHWCRSSQKIEAARHYIINNPVKAGLVGQQEDWHWTKVGRAFVPDRKPGHSVTCGRTGRNACLTKRR